MEKRIIHSENAPDKKYLWLHSKNNNLVLEAYGNNGWESVGDEVNEESLVDKVAKKVLTSKNKAIKVTLPSLTENCTKKELISAVDTLSRVLRSVGIIEIK